MDRNLRERRQNAMDFYRQNNRVLEQLERALNEMCVRRPNDLFGYLAEFFIPLSATPLISRVEGVEVLDSRGGPSIQAQVYCTLRNQEKFFSSGSVSSHFGSSASSEERQEQVRKALQWIQEVNQQLHGLSPEEQSKVDQILSDLYWSRLQELTDHSSRTPTETPPVVIRGKKRAAVKIQPPPEPPELLLSGGLAVGALSLSVARAGAQSRGLPLYKYITELKTRSQRPPEGLVSPLSPPPEGLVSPSSRPPEGLVSPSSPPPEGLHSPTLLVPLFSCGRSSPGKLHLFEEVLLIPKPGLRTRQVVLVAQQLQQEVFRIHAAQTKATAGAVSLSDSGAPHLPADRLEQPLELLTEACAQLQLGPELRLGLSCAGPHLYDQSKGKYEVMCAVLKSPDETVDLLQSLLLKFPSVVLLIDPLRREDVDQWQRLSASCSLLSDITFREQAPPPPGVTGHILKHVNHVTITDLIQASIHRHGSMLLGPSYSEPSCDSALPDLAVGLGLDFLKLGGLSGEERTSRYNRLMRIEEELEQEGRLCLKEKRLPPIFIQRPGPGPDQGLKQDRTSPRSRPGADA
ncbi:unnamed protein product [Knipowitschia caucasica]